MCVISLSAWAQNAGDGKHAADVFKKSSVMKTYRSNMKDKNYSGAKKQMDDAIARYEVAANDAQLYKYKLDALNELIVGENRKIYLNSRPDTTTYFNYMFELYTTGLKCDSLEQIDIRLKHEAGKKAEPKLRYGVGQTLLPYRKNLLNAGKFYYKKKDYAASFRFFDMYLKTKNSSVFLDSKDKNILSDPDDLNDISVLAVLSAFASSNYQDVVAYLDDALQNKYYEKELLEIGSKAASELKDTTAMVRFLETGFRAYPNMEYFFITLTRYYNDVGSYDQALEKAKRMTDLSPGRRDYWFMVGKELMLLRRDEEALSAFEKCVEIKADDAESFSAIGNIYLHSAHEAYARFSVPLTDPAYAQQKAAIDGLYKKACFAFEQARKFDESNLDLWLSGLRESYFKLNRGRELRALEKFD